MAAYLGYSETTTYYLTTYYHYLPSMAADLGYSDALQRVDDEHARDELLGWVRVGVRGWG